MNAAWEENEKAHEAEGTEESVGWGESSMGWLRAVDQAEEREEVLKVVGSFDAVNKQAEENQKKTKTMEFCFKSGSAKNILRPRDVVNKNIMATKDTGRSLWAANGGRILTWEQWNSMEIQSTSRT